MGFLLGGYGKHLARSRIHEIQKKMMNVQSQLRMAQRQSADVEKWISNETKQKLNNLSLYSTMGMQGMQNANMGTLAGLRNSIFGNWANLDYNAIQNLSSEDQKAYANMQSQYTMESALINNQMQQMQQMNQMNLAQMKTQIENEAEMMKELQLQPLKDLEEELAREKDSLESQLSLAEADYDACKKMEQSGVKNLVPQYTGQG